MVHDLEITFLNNGKSSVCGQNQKNIQTCLILLADSKAKQIQLFEKNS